MNNEEFVRRAYEVAEAKDIAAWIDCFNPDGVFVDESVGVTYSGPSEVAKPVENYGRAFSDITAGRNRAENGVGQALAADTESPLHHAQAFFASVAAFRHTVTNVWSDLDAIVAELRVHYTRLDGAELTLPCCNVFRLRDGAVADYRVYMDITPVYR